MNVPKPRDPLIRRLLWPAALLIGVTTYGVGGYMLLEGWSFIDALYMTVITLSTVGFREVQPLDATGRAFTLSLVVLGVTAVLVGLTLIGIWISEGNLGERRRRKRMKHVIDRLEGHFVVCAFGRVGRTVARRFLDAGVPFVVVDRDEALEARMVDMNVPHLIGDPSDEEVLHQAGIDRARGLVCAVDSDATNVFITLTARALKPDLFIVARAATSESIPRLEKAGADRVVSPYVTSGEAMALMSLRQDVVGMLDVADLGDRDVRVEELVVSAGSHLEGLRVKEAAGQALALALRHADGSTTVGPSADRPLRAGDRLLLMADERTLQA
ncbi:MAG TPA: potassium channel family protein [Actinomycetota bacterium]